ncbi:MAG: YhbY family RNA-binding protein [Burkholderia sp.]|nr:YhbY family RNA-binding protein [Burkholderia sp.]
MPALSLSPAERSALRSQAHALKPVVLIGAEGLTDAVLKEIKVHLNAHQLIKIRVFGDERDERIAIYDEICDRLSAAPIQHIGKLLVLWRPMPEKLKEADDNRMPGPREVKVLKYSKRGGQRPEVKVVKVLGNERLTPGGQIKRARPTQKSAKKNALNAPGKKA